VSLGSREVVAMPVLAGWFTDWVLTPMFVIIAVLLILLILIQKGRGGGLVGAFSGLGSQGALGTKAGDVMTWITVFMAGIFLVIAMLLTRNVTMEYMENKAPRQTQKSGE